MNFFAEILEGLRISWSAILANRMRSVLTTLGVIIGVLTVTMMATAINGLNAAFQTSISIMGADVVYVQRFGWFMDRSEWLLSRNRREITMDQVRGVERLLTSAKAISPVAMTRRDVVYQKRSGGAVQIIGTTETQVETGSMTLSQGRFFASTEVDGARPVCVIGDDVATRLFPTESPIGRRLPVGDRSLEVVGVVEKRGRFLGMFSLDEVVFLPITFFLNAYEQRPDLRIDVKVGGLGGIEESREELIGIMRKLRKTPPGEPDDFAINAQEAFVKNFSQVGVTIASLGLFVTGLSLFVGGIGIMNIMFVSVSERTKEIGIRRAIGAKRRTILLQFLIEAVLLCLMGGVIALLLAAPITLGVALVLPAALSPSIILIALGVSIVTGVVSGFVPAYRASRMSPVDALRSE